MINPRNLVAGHAALIFYDFALERELNKFSLRRGEVGGGGGGGGAPGMNQSSLVWESSG